MKGCKFVRFKKLSAEEYNKLLNSLAAFAGLAVMNAPTQEERGLMGAHFDHICKVIGGENFVDDVHRRLDAIIIASELRKGMEEDL